MNKLYLLQQKNRNQPFFFHLIFLNLKLQLKAAKMSAGAIGMNVFNVVQCAAALTTVSRYILHLFTYACGTLQMVPNE